MPSLAGLRFRSQTRPRARLSAIGLEFAEHRLNLVQLEHEQSTRIRAYASTPYPMERSELLSSPAALKVLLKQCMRQAPFKGRRVIAALPTEDVRILTVTYQARSNESDDHAIARLMRDRVGEDLAQFVIDYVPIRMESRDGERLAIVLLSERNKVIRFLEHLRLVGLDVKALEVVPVATRRLVSMLIGAGALPENILIINTGAEKTSLTMVSGRRLLFEQTIEFGELAVLDEVAAALDTPRDLAREIVFRRGLSAERGAEIQGLEDTSGINAIHMLVRPFFSTLVGEIRRAALFAASETRGSTVDHACLMGTLAHWPGASELLGQLAEMPVSILRPLPFADPAGTAEEARIHPELVVAAGLALRGFGADA